jgi:hypothetical protein
MHLVGNEPRRRALREDVKLARSERTLADPLRRQLEHWHNKASGLAGAAHHALMRGKAVEGLAKQVDDLLDEVTEALETWRAGIPSGMAGHVDDADKSCRSVIANLDQLRARLRT